MIFRFPQKKIVLDCFTDNSSVIELAPVLPAVKLIPDWWKNLPQSMFDEETLNGVTTMKNCVGMVDYYAKSIAIPMWCDVSIKINKNKTYNWQFADRISKAEVHNIEEQAKGFLPEHGHLKLVSPWLFKTKENINWVWSHPTYNYANNADITSLPAISNYYHQNGSNINMMINLNSAKTIVIPHLTPVALLTPMSDRKVEVVRHLVSTEEFQKITNRNTTITFINKYKKIIKTKKQLGNCPFHSRFK